MKNEMTGKASSHQQPNVCGTASPAARGHKFGRVLVGVGGLSALLALLCCAAPWLLGGLILTLGLGFILRDSVLLSLAAVGMIVAVIGWRLMRRRAGQAGGAA